MPQPVTNYCTICKTVVDKLLEHAEYASEAEAVAILTDLLAVFGLDYTAESQRDNDSDDETKQRLLQEK